MSDDWSEFPTAPPQATRGRIIQSDQDAWMQEQDEISRKNVSYGGQDWSAFPTSPTVVGGADSYAQSAAAIAPLLGITANSLD